MALNLKPVLTNERYVQYMARESALYDPDLAVDENVGAEYLTMMSNLAGKDIDVSKYKPGVARYLSNEDKVNYIWNNYFNEDADLAAEYNKGLPIKRIMNAIVKYTRLKAVLKRFSAILVVRSLLLVKV